MPLWESRIVSQGTEKIICFIPTRDNGILLFNNFISFRYGHNGKTQDNEQYG